MKVGRPSYVVIERPPGSAHHTVRISPALGDLIKNWCVSTRISPIFAVTGTTQATPENFDFRGRGTLILLGPVHPDRLVASCGRMKHLWIGLGLYNNLAVASSTKQLKSIEQWAARERI